MKIFREWLKSNVLHWRVAFWRWAWLKKRCKKVQIELEKKRNDDNLRSCRRSKSVMLLKSSTAA